LTEAELTAIAAALTPDALVAPVEVEGGDGSDDGADAKDAATSAPMALAPRADPADLVLASGDWAIMVRVLGPVDVVDRDGRAVVFDRAKSLELVVWIAQHAATATRAGARAALWDLDVANASFSNVVSEARRALARAVPSPSGEDWILRTYAERLPFRAGIVLDADLVAAHLARARTLDGKAAIDELRAGLALVRGAPYVGTSYLWPDAEALPSTLTLLATTVAGELATRCLHVGDIEGAFAATGVGLEVLPGHEELVALRMRAHARRGDRSGVRREFAAYERAVLSDVWAGGEPSAQLTSLRQELLDGLVEQPLPIAGS
jgi:two-component SAPR family response regulator